MSNFRRIYIISIICFFQFFVSPIFSETAQSNFYTLLYHKYKKQLPYLKRSNPKIAVFFFGTPGMGKSTIAKLVEKEFLGLRISSDDIRNLTTDIGLQPSQSSGFSKYLINYLVRNSKNHFLIIDRSIDGAIPSLVRQLKSKGYQIVYIRLAATRDQVEERIRKRGIETEKLLSGLGRSFARYELSAAKYPADCVVDILNEKSITMMRSCLKERLKKHKSLSNQYSRLGPYARSE